MCQNFFIFLCSHDQFIYENSCSCNDDTDLVPHHTFLLLVHLVIYSSNNIHFFRRDPWKKIFCSFLLIVLGVKIAHILEVKMGRSKKYYEIFSYKNKRTDRGMNKFGWIVGYFKKIILIARKGKKIEIFPFRDPLC